MLDSQTQRRNRSPVAAPPQWRCLRFEDANQVRVAIAGELDVATAPELDRVLRSAQADAGLVVLDLRRLDFADCSGAHVVLDAERRARTAGDRFAVVRGPPEIDKLFALTGADAALWLVDDPAAVARRDASRERRTDARHRRAASAFGPVDSSPAPRGRLDGLRDAPLAGWR